MTKVEIKEVKPKVREVKEIEKEKEKERKKQTEFSDSNDFSVRNSTPLMSQSPRKVLEEIEEIESPLPQTENRKKREDREFYETVHGAQSSGGERKRYMQNSPPSQPESPQMQPQATRAGLTQRHLLEGDGIRQTDVSNFREALLGPSDDRKYNYDEKQQQDDMHVRRRKELF